MTALAEFNLGEQRAPDTIHSLDFGNREINAIDLDAFDSLKKMPAVSKELKFCNVQGINQLSTAQLVTLVRGLQHIRIDVRGSDLSAEKKAAIRQALQPSILEKLRSNKYIGSGMNWSWLTALLYGYAMQKSKEEYDCCADDCTRLAVAVGTSTIATALSITGWIIAPKWYKPYWPNSIITDEDEHQHEE